MALTSEETSFFFGNLPGLRIAVVGDVMIDAYLHGKVERISPEAPVPVVALRQRQNCMGGAANVALNIKSLGASVCLCSVIGNDRQGDVFMEMLENEKLPSTGIVRSKHRITTTKFRVMGNKTQMLRVDEEMTSDLIQEDEKRLLYAVQTVFRDFNPHLVLLQDYNKGVLTSHCIQQIIQSARAAGIPIAVDPKKKNFDAFKGVTLFKPNLKEVSEGLGLSFTGADHDRLDSVAITLLHDWHIEQLMVTLSEHGVYYARLQDGKLQSFILPAHERSISDVSGAGDTVISVAALCLASGTGCHFMVELANLAGGIVCELPGVVAIESNTLMAEAHKHAS